MTSVGIRSFVKDLRTPVAELDAQKRRGLCTAEGCTPIAELVPRREATVLAEITSLRIVPHDGSPWLEATITDGTGSMVVLWTGRRRIAGVNPGKRLRVTGRASATTGNRLTVYNPTYELV